MQPLSTATTAREQPSNTAAPPRPRAHPLLGSALDLRRNQIGTYERLMREFGDWELAARNGGMVDANAEMVQLALRVVGRAIFGEDTTKASAVLDSSFGVLNRHTFRRALSPLATPRSWPTPDTAAQNARGERSTRWSTN
jgi:hypothetical protein